LGQSLADTDIPFYARYVMPNGTGLPQGSGSALAGKGVWEIHCASCHGETGNEGPIMPPVGPTPAYLKSAGKFWPHSTTLFDYIRRAMPFAAPKTLSDDEVYAVTAFILFRNGLIKEDAVIDAKTLPDVAMPGRDQFIDLWAKQKEEPY
jgi:cytochrome c